MSLRRSAWMAIVALGTLAWTPARAQTAATAADLSVALTDDSAGDPFVYASTRTFTATIANAGPSHASGITLAVSLPAFPAADGTLVLGAVGGCTEVAGTRTATGVTCSVPDIGDGATAAVTFDVKLAKPLDAHDAVVIPAACPSADIGPFTVTVATDPTVTEDGDLANNTATESLPIAPWAELAVAMTPQGLTVAADGTTAPVEPGATVQYNVVVHNDGPCTATGIKLDDGSGGDVGALNPFFTLVSINGDTTATFLYDLADVAAGADSPSIPVVYTAASALPDGVRGIYVNMPETMGAEASTDAADAGATATLTTPIHFNKEGGCASVGGLDLAALLGVAALGLRRRRKA